MEQEASKTGNSVRSIFVRTKSNEGIVVPLKDFPGANWVRVRGIDSDPVQEAVTAFYRARAAEKTDAASEKAGPFEDVTVIASMIAGWSFDEEPTVEVIRETLAEVPSLRIAVVNAGLERANFLPKSAAPSSTTPEESSS